MASGARRGEPLTPDEIYETALRLVDTGGVEALSMRKLASELDVNPMSLYHHVDSKTVLIQHVCGLVTSRLELPPDDGSPWPDQLRMLAHAYRALAHTHPALWSYVELHPELIGREDGMWAVLRRILVAAGVPETDVIPTAETLYAFVSGFVTAEIRGLIGQDPRADSDRSFSVGVDLILFGLMHLDGLASRSGPASYTGR